MDSTVLPTGSKKPFHLVLLRCLSAMAFSASCILSLAFATAFLALSLAKFSIAPPVFMPSQCKIVSRSVDLRSSKVCELGLLNFKAKRVFYPSEIKRFRCHYDYYWASVFKVEYKDHFSGQTLLGLAEAPKEALPFDCRPNFATALLTKQIFKVNESYDCWYTSGLSKVDIYQDDYFGCQVKDPSAMEMVRRYFILSTRMLNSWLSGQGMAGGMSWGMIAGAASGFFTSMMSVVMLKMLRQMVSWLSRVGGATMVAMARRMLFSRLFFILAYFFVVGWLGIQYGKRIGLPFTFLEY
ncbi:hypothetical protein Nepgr_030627 [Nepenthes gracilis]|uniref:Uncharacterized protein n=1 Tax=Nepenthes gracilis TaxID=150966 RepID=A0AAD3Y687_NEPGR|nr:hypothetical protein Nepgr_030627 [Nepenthes gracilis]